MARMQKAFETGGTLGVIAVALGVKPKAALCEPSFVTKLPATDVTCPVEGELVERLMPITRRTRKW